MQNFFHSILCVCIYSAWEHAQSLQLCPTLCDPVDCSPPGSSVRGILQARILEWAAVPSSKGSSWPEDRTCISYTAGGFFTCWSTGEAHIYIYSVYMYILCVDFLILNECIGFGFGVIKFIQQIPLRTFELLKTSFSYYKLVIFKVLFRSKLLPKYKSIYCFLKKVFLWKKIVTWTHSALKSEIDLHSGLWSPGRQITSHL